MVRAIIIKDDQLLTMHRNKFGRQYYTLIGGGIDHGETPEQSLYREIAEETGITVENERLVFVEDAGEFYGRQHIYLCDYVSGEPVLAADSEEAQINALGENLYTPTWLPLSELAAVPFLSTSLQQQLLRAVQQGFPKEPVTFTHQHQ